MKFRNKHHLPISKILNLWIPVKRLTILYTGLLCSTCTFAYSLNDSIKGKTIHRLGIDIHPSYVVPTHKYIKGKNPNHEVTRFAISAHAKYSFRFPKDSRFGKLYPHAYQGIGFGYNRFINSNAFGHPFALYALQGSRIAQIKKKLTFDYEWNFGITFGWKEYDKLLNERNHVIGTDLDVYMNLAFLLNWRLTANATLNAGIGFTHCSNGNTHYPNQGINIVESKLGLTISLNDKENRCITSIDSPTTALHLPKKITYDFIAYSGFRVRELRYDGIKYIPREKFLVLGINFNPMYRFNNNLHGGASLDLQYDESSNLRQYVTGVIDNKIQYTKQPFHERVSAGISLRGEWAMPVFSINAGIGYNLYAKSFDTKRFYQVLAMKIFMGNHAFLHIGYQMNQFKDPNNLMLGMGYRI